MGIVCSLGMWAATNYDLPSLASITGAYTPNCDEGSYELIYAKQLLNTVASGETPTPKSAFANYFVYNGYQYKNQISGLTVNPTTDATQESASDSVIVVNGTYECIANSTYYKTILLNVSGCSKIDIYWMSAGGGGTAKRAVLEEVTVDGDGNITGSTSLAKASATVSTKNTWGGILSYSLDANSSHILSIGADTGTDGATSASNYTGIWCIKLYKPVASKCATPNIAIGDYSYANHGYQVSMSCSTASSTITYSTDGGTTNKTYTGNIYVAGNTTIQAYATATGFTQSETASQTTAAAPAVPTPTINVGAYDAETGKYTVTIAESLAGATIWYTTDNWQSTSSYDSALALEGVTIQAQATYTGETSSAYASATVLGTGEEQAHWGSTTAGTATPNVSLVANVATVGDAFNVNGTDVSSVGSYSGITVMKVINKAAETDPDATTTKGASSAVTFSATVQDGYVFCPTKISFYAMRSGSASGDIIVDYQYGNTAKELCNTPAINQRGKTGSDGNDISYYTYDISSQNVKVYPGQNISVVAYLVGVGNNNKMAFGEVTIEGTYYEVKAVAVNSTGISSCVTSKPLDFTDMDVKCYIVTDASDLNSTTLTLTRVNKVESGAYFVKGEASKTYYVPVLTGTPETYTNVLYGTTSNFTVPSGAIKYWALQSTDGLLHPIDAETVVPANITLLMTSAGAGTKRLVFNDETTGISSIKNEESGIKNSAACNLAGQRVNANAKGLVIINGRKYINK